MRKTNLLFTIISVLIIFTSTQINAQITKGSKSGKISGRIIDPETKSPVEFASIALKKSKDSTIVTGMLSNDKGEFVFDKLAFDKYLIQLSYVGYKTRNIDSIDISPEKPEVKLDSVWINTTSTSINQVVVTAQQSLYTTKIDRKIFNVDQSIASQSGSATDVLKNVPSVDVDVDGNVSLRGSDNVTILINGKPSNLTSSTMLQQIPANTIEKIEIITNPSAKYDPDGMSGIINIVLKQDAKMGFNGNVTANAGTNDKYNGSVNLNYNPGKLNVSTTYSYRNDRRFGGGYTNLSSLVNDTTSHRNQLSDGTNHNINHLAKLGVDYKFNKYNTIGVAATYSNRNSVRFSNTDYYNYWESKNIRQKTDSSYRSNDETETGYNLDYSLNYYKTFSKPNHELKFIANRSIQNETNNSNYQQGEYLSSIFSNDRNNSKSINDISILQLDYSLPINENIKYEGGFKSTFRTFDTDLNYEKLNNSVWVNDATKTNHFIYNDQIHAVYSTLAQTIDKFGYQIGMRAEDAIINTELVSTKEINKNSYISLYPSVHLSYKLPKDQEILLSYSRRVNRPGSRQLSPFPDYSNPKSIRLGNPYLKPEYINSFELGYIKNIQRNSFQGTVFYRKTLNAFNPKIEINDSISIMKPINIGSTQSYGAEAIFIWYITKWWNINSSGSLFQYIINITDTTSKQGLMWNGKILSTMSIPKIADIQITGFYRSPQLTAQGQMHAMYSVDLGLRKNVLKGKGTIVVSVTDIFNTRKFAMDMTTGKYITNGGRIFESRVAFLGFTYRFGSTPQKQPSKRNNGKMDDSGAPDDNMMF